MATADDTRTAAPRPRRRHRVLRILAWLLLAVVLLLVLAVAGLTLWARTDGSLATALRLAGGPLPLTSRNASGAILGRGEIENLVWDQNGLRVEVEDAVLDWRPGELLKRRLHVARLSAKRIVVDDQSPPKEDKPPSSGLPDSLALPFGLRIAVDTLEVGEIRLQGPPRRTLHDIQANYHFDGQQHALALQSAHYEDEDYQATLQAQATAGARAPVPLSALVTGAASAKLPEAQAPALAALQAKVGGTLADMQAELRLQAAPGAADYAGTLTLPPLPAADASLQTEPNLAWPSHGEAPPVRLDAVARLTPQEALPLQDASAELHALDLHAFLPQAPDTRLAAQINVTPLAAGSDPGGAGWALRARVVNDEPGPWDAQQLPMDGLTAAASWQDGVATLESLLLELAGGRMESNGQWHSNGNSAGADGGSWQLDSRIAHVDPAQLYGDLAAFPIDGAITAKGRGADAEFDVALDAAEGADEASAENAAASSQDADALAQQLRALALRQVRATGRFADGLLALERVLVATDDARLTGSADVNLADTAQLTVDGDVALDAPGLKLSAQARALAADAGAAQARLDLGDAGAALNWAKKLPGAADALAGAKASGSGELDAELRDGWLDPALQARLRVPKLDVTPPSANNDASTIQVRALDSSVEGRLEQAKLALRGRILEPAHQVDLQLALDAAGGWADQVLTLDSLLLQAGEASASGHARLDLAQAFSGEADLQLKAPGLSSTVKGKLAPESGDGRIDLDLSDAAATLRWAQTLPGAADALAGARASGTARLDGSWQGGMKDPRIDATLAAPRLDYVATSDAQSLSVRDLQAKLAGTLQDATLSTRGHVVQGERRVDLQLAADGGRASRDSQAWRLRISQLAAQLQAPELGDGQWKIASRNAVPLSWDPAQGGQLEVAAGELTITSPDTEAPSRIVWEPVHWRAGQLTSAGRISELPMAWAQRIAGEQLDEAGISGDLVLGGRWDVQMGRNLKLDARVERISGDLHVRAGNTGDSDADSVPVGLRQAWVDVSSSGNDVKLALNWDSERAGTVTGEVNTRLAASRGANGKTSWSWSDQAPLRGQLRAELPEISVWSLLAPPGWRLHGSLGANLQISGSAAQPQLAGTLAADDLALRSVVDGLQFEDGRLRAHLAGTRLIIDEFLLHGAGDDGSGGSIRVTGEAGLLDGEPGAQLRAVIDKLHASVRSDREMVASGQIDASLRDQTVSASGTLTVDHAHIVLPDESRPSLSDDVVIHGLDDDDRAAVETAREPGAGSEAAEARAEAEERAKDSPLRADINVKIDLGEDFQVDGMGIDTRLAGNLELTANGPLTEMPSLKGRVETVGGTFQAYGQHLNIERGRVFFSGDVSNPGLDILALRPNYTSDQQVGALVQGTALLPQVKLYSKPTLPDDQVLAWLILGHAAPEDGGEAAMMQSAALALLGGREGGGVASSLGLDELSFGGDTSEGVAGASVTLGKRLSDRLYTAYEHSLSGTGGVLLIFYDLSKRWVVRGQASESSAVDLIYRLSYD